jgi:predicted transcriptional regulator
MQQSTLETYVHLLKMLAHKGPLKRTHLMNKAKISYGTLQQFLNFSIKEKLVDEKKSKKDGELFTVTQKGITILNYFVETQQVVIN